MSIFQPDTFWQRLTFSAAFVWMLVRWSYVTSMLCDSGSVILVSDALKRFRGGSVRCSPIRCRNVVPACELLLRCRMCRWWDTLRFPLSTFYLFGTPFVYIVKVTNDMFFSMHSVPALYHLNARVLELWAASSLPINVVRDNVELLDHDYIWQCSLSGQNDREIWQESGMKKARRRNVHLPTIIFQLSPSLYSTCRRAVRKPGQKW
jgi:hypothetical protein